MSLATSYGMKKRNKCAHGGYAGSCGECYAKGGEAKKKEKGYATKSSAFHETQKGVNRQEYHYGDKKQMGTSEAGFQGELKRIASTERFKKDSAKNEKDKHRETLSDLRSMKGPTSGKSGFAEGGEVDDQDMKAGAITDNEYKTMVDESEDDIVDRILQQRYSKGGRVANETEELAGFAPNEFDDLVLRDDLESSYTGENSGDYIGNEGEDDRREDIVSRILRSLRKRPGHNPNPA